MRAIFQSKFPDLKRIRECAEANSKMIRSGKRAYLKFIDTIEALQEIDDGVYKSIPDIYDFVDIKFPFAPMSKRKLYEAYSSGVVVGAGSGEDCIDLIGSDNWKLFDLSDERMDNRAIGYCEKTGYFNMTGTPDGDTITSVAERYKKGLRAIQFIKIDQIDFADTGIGIISMDVEGSALDVLSGSIEVILEYKPDLLVSIYHNWMEYLLIIPMLYDLGYNIEIATTSNFSPEQPHLELTLFCKPMVKK